MLEEPTRDHCPSPNPLRRPVRGTWLLTSLLLLALCWPASAGARGLPSRHADLQTPAGSVDVAPGTWADLLQRLWHWWTGADGRQTSQDSQAVDGIASGSTEPGGVEPGGVVPDGDAAGSGSDPLNPQPDPAEEPKDERGSVIDPNGTTPQ